MAVSTIEDELDGDICTILDTADVGSCEIYWHTECAFSRSLEVLLRDEEVAAAIREIGEGVGILVRRDDYSHYVSDISYRTLCHLIVKMKKYVRVH